MYKLRYSRLISFGTFENRKVELEMEFIDEIPKPVAMKGLVQETLDLHAIADKEEERIINQHHQREQWQMKLGDMQSQIQQLKEKKAQLEEAERSISKTIMNLEEQMNEIIPQSQSTDGHNEG